MCRFCGRGFEGDLFFISFLRMLSNFYYLILEMPGGLGSHDAWVNMLVQFLLPVSKTL